MWRLGLLALLLICTGCAGNGGPVGPVTADEYAVYRAVILSQFEGAGTIVVAQTTGLGPVDSAEGIPDRLASLRKDLPAISVSLAKKFQHLNAGASTLEDHLGLPQPVVLLPASEHEAIFRQQDAWDEFYRRYPGAQGVMELSRVAIAGNMALVYVGNQSHGLVGAGYYVLLQKQGADWVVTSKVMVWIS